MGESDSSQPPDPSPAPPTPASALPPDDFQKWLHDIVRQDAHRAHDELSAFHRSVNDAAIKSAEVALRAALLINGGAAVAILAFIGGLAAQDRIKLEQLNEVANSLMLFAFGVVAAVAGMGLDHLPNYLTGVHATSFVRWSQHPYIRPGPKTSRLARLRTLVHVVGVLVGVGSVVLFVCGMYDVRNSISRFH
jgi:hypothetical protein